MSNVEIHQELDLIYLTGQLLDSREIFIPLTTDQTITLDKIVSIQNDLLTRHKASRQTIFLYLSS